MNKFFVYFVSAFLVLCSSCSSLSRTEKNLTKDDFVKYFDEILKTRNTNIFSVGTIIYENGTLESKNNNFISTNFKFNVDQIVQLKANLYLSNKIDYTQGNNKNKFYNIRFYKKVGRLKDLNNDIIFFAKQQSNVAVE